MEGDDIPKLPPMSCPKIDTKCSSAVLDPSRQIRLSWGTRLGVNRSQNQTDHSGIPKCDTNPERYHRKDPCQNVCKRFRLLNHSWRSTSVPANEQAQCIPCLSLVLIWIPAGASSGACAATRFGSHRRWPTMPRRIGHRGTKMSAHRIQPRSESPSEIERKRLVQESNVRSPR